MTYKKLATKFLSPDDLEKAIAEFSDKAEASAGGVFVGRGSVRQSKEDS